MVANIASLAGPSLRSVGELMKRFPPKYWVLRILHLLVTVYFASFFVFQALGGDGVSGVGATLAWIYLFCGCLLFPLADYWAAGSSRRLYWTHGSDFSAVWDGRRRMSTNVNTFLFVKVIRAVWWLFTGIVTLTLWPLFLPVSIMQAKHHVKLLDQMWSLPIRMFEGHIPTSDEEDLWNSLNRLKVRNLWSIVKKIDSGRRLDPEQEGWADELNLFDAYRRAQE